MARQTNQQNQQTQEDQNTQNQLESSLAENEKLRKELDDLKVLVAQLVAANKDKDNSQSEVKSTKNDFYKDIEEELNISPHRMVKIVSMVIGGLNLRGSNNVIVHLPEFGSSRRIPFEELRAIYNNHPDLTRSGAFFIVDPLAVKALYLEDDYENLLNQEMMENIIDLPTNEITRTLNNLPKLQRDTVLQRIVRGIASGEERYSDLNKIKVFSDIAGVDLVTIAREI
jgi:hypothetical protein